MGSSLQVWWSKYPRSYCMKLTSLFDADFLTGEDGAEVDFPALKPEIPDGPRQRHALALVDQEAPADRQVFEVISIGTLPPGSPSFGSEISSSRQVTTYLPQRQFPYVFPTIPPPSMSQKTAVPAGQFRYGLELRI